MKLARYVLAAVLLAGAFGTLTACTEVPAGGPVAPVTTAPAYAQARDYSVFWVEITKGSLTYSIPCVWVEKNTNYSSAVSGLSCIWEAGGIK